jgi:uncharacterized protein (TIGR02145 family)
MKTLKSISMLLVATTMFFSCSKEEDNNGYGSSLTGVWVRTDGPSGDQTNIAIGNIPGEPENRVYVCEYVGNVGLYKGYLNGNTITWDSNYGLPDASVKRVGAQLEFYYPSVSYSIPTLYDSGQWSSQCGSLENSSIKLAVGLDNSSSATVISNVTIDGIAIPLQLLNSVTTMPDCDTPNWYLTLPEPAQSNQNGGYYLVKVTFSQEGVSGWYTETHTSAFYKYYFETNSCNTYKVAWGSLGYTIIPMTTSGGGGGIVTNPGAGVSFNGYNYSSIVLGNGQEWMAENLRTTAYANGDPIPNVTGNAQWQNLTTGAWSHYNNDNQYENPYGKLYNWYTVADARNVCPTGWHVPTDAEYTLLTDYLGGEIAAIGKMKSTGTQYWISQNTDATNESGFSGLPGGFRSNDGFHFVGNYGFWWSSTEDDTYDAWSRFLFYGNSNEIRTNGGKGLGLCVRCLRN